MVHGPRDQAEASDFRRRLLVALAEIGEPYKSVIILREVQGLQHQPGLRHRNAVRARYSPSTTVERLDACQPVEV